jgi:short-subunit dehydrogenase
MTAVLITGASSGLGAALAAAYAAPGTTLFLGGRDEVRLAAVVAHCAKLGADVRPQWVDVRDRTGMEDWIFAAGRETALDVVIANAGISGGPAKSEGESAAQARDIFAVNIDGVVNTALPAIELMRKRGCGQLALMASLAGFRGLPTAPAYAASKAAVKAWGEGLRGWLAADGVGVTVLCPGFVESRMTAGNAFPMPFLMGATEAAQVMKRGIDANRARVAFPWPMATTAWLLAALPPAWADSVLRRLPDKA